MRIFFITIFITMLFVSCTDSKSDVDDSQMSDTDLMEIADETDETDETDDVDETGIVDNQDTVDETDKVDDVDLTQDSDLIEDFDLIEDNDLTDDEVADETPDEIEDEAPDEDTPTADHVEVINNADGSVTVNVTLNAEKDAVTSYLMDASSSSWNYFHGSSINIGFRVYSVLDDQYVAYHSAFRFTDVDVPAGATIESANFSFHPTNEVDSSKKIYLRAAMEKAVNSADFDVSNYTTNRPDQ